MKDNKGITLAALVIYVIVMIMSIGIISAILTRFHSNNTKLNESSKDVLEFSNFNAYFLKEVKIPGNKIEEIKNTEDGSNYILFSSGNSFSLENNIIKYNGVKICERVKSLAFESDVDDDTIITVNIEFEDGKFSKEMKYKIEEIY